MRCLSGERRQKCKAPYKFFRKKIGGYPINEFSSKTNRDEHLTNEFSSKTLCDEFGINE